MKRLDRLFLYWSSEKSSFIRYGLAIALTAAGLALRLLIAAPEEGLPFITFFPAATLAAMPARPTWLICGMLSTKDIGGYLRPLAPHVRRLHAVSIPGEHATLSAEQTRAAAAAAGIDAVTAPSVAAALAAIAAEAPAARVLICGSLYLAGSVLQENG